MDQNGFCPVFDAQGSQNANRPQFWAAISDAVWVAQGTPVLLLHVTGPGLSAIMLIIQILTQKLPGDVLFVGI